VNINNKTEMYSHRQRSLAHLTLCTAAECNTTCRTG